MKLTPQVIKDLARSEKAVVSLGVLIAATVLCALGHVTVEQWLEFAKWVLLVYVGGKSVQGAASALARRGVAPQAKTEQAQTTDALAANDAKADADLRRRFE